MECKLDHLKEFMKKKRKISLPKEEPEPEPGNTTLVPPWFAREYSGAESVSPLAPYRWEREKLI